MAAHTHSLRIQLAPDFFSPRPRAASLKGKERMYNNPSNEPLLSFFSAKSQEWSCRMRVSVWCLDGVERAESPRKRPRGPRRARSATPPHRSVSLLQRRHASQFFDPPPPPHDGEYPAEPLDPPSETAAADNVDDPDPPRNVPDPPTEELHKLRACATQRMSYSLNELWMSFEVVEARGYLPELSSLELLALAESLVDEVESTNQLDDLEDLHTWAERVRRVLKGVPDSDKETLWYLNARLLALSGDVQEALDIVRAQKPNYDAIAPHLHVYEAILVSIWRHYDRLRALEFLVHEWKTLGSYLLTETSRIHSGSEDIAEAGRSLRTTAFAIISALPDPAAFLRAKESDWDDIQRQHMGDLLVEACIRADLALDALQVLLQMRRQHLESAPHLQLLLVRALAREHCFSEAHQLFSSIPHKRTFDFFYTGLYLNAREGLETEAIWYYNRIADAGWINPKVVVQLMYIYAVQGRADETFRVFQEHYPLDADGKPTNNPLLQHFCVGLFAYAQQGDFVGTRLWLDLIRTAGFQPDAYVFSIVLKTFALRGDLDSIRQVLNQMREAGCDPNHVTYTTIMTLLAHRKDPANVEAIYARAIREGVVPDTKMIATVMNAHVEAASWSGVIRAFDFIRTSPHGKLTIGIYNILLKAYVQIGSPYRVVLRVFEQLENLRIRPDQYTFSLLIQCACNSRRMDIATKVFTEMETLAEDWGSHRHITTWAMTLIMAGFLRMGLEHQAMEVYGDMQKRGLKPNAVTYGRIINFHGIEGTEESFQLAEEFIKQVTEMPNPELTWDKQPYGRLPSRSRLYLPLMRAYIAKGRYSDVTRLYDEIIQNGGEPTLSLLDKLLQSYVAAGDIRSVLALWPQIFELGVKYCAVPVLEEDFGEEMNARMHTFVLCIPLSRYLTALAKAGDQEEEIARVWRDFQEHGFSFSPDNWTKLALAFIRAGEVERAFEVVERVFVPYSHLTEQARRERTPKPSSPLTMHGDADAIKQPLQILKSSQRRNRENKWGTRHRRKAAELDTVHLDDLAYQLHIVHQILPIWNSWAVQTRLLRALFTIVLRLRAGHPYNASYEDIKADESGVTSEEFQQQRQEEAHDRLQNLLVNFPDAMAVVAKFEQRQEKLHGKMYSSVHKWAAAPGLVRQRR
ncbi:hypothetical protein HMN09_01274100 [Mycena chlorophos]|uniref:Pentacotripeptide-repeat region of PRORP domain-containing protein n=1 Tax=Mycena chlorophos TaxID=658473 RepID=A0A8H6S2D0_MYCCL|nr:hypothetical protein HMN09_01274100 [Mycena chlorophos]